MVARDVEQFMQMTTDGGKFAPTTMPMTPAIAPMFTERYPEAAIVFDNLHSLHDVVSDILASPKVPSGQKRAAILTAISRYRDSTSFTTTREEWLSMSRDMGGVDTTTARLGDRGLLARPRRLVARWARTARPCSECFHSTLPTPRSPPPAPAPSRASRPPE